MRSISILKIGTDRAGLVSPALFLENVEDRLVILDEIYLMPELIQTLRGIVDAGRRKQKGKGPFLILGSVSIDLLRQFGESLAGRISYINMTPLTATEIGDDRAARERLWLCGGFPDNYLAGSDRDSLTIRKDFIRTYLERDVPMFGPRIPAETLERLWIMPAHRQESLLCLGVGPGASDQHADRHALYRSAGRFAVGQEAPALSR